MSVILVSCGKSIKLDLTTKDNNMIIGEEQTVLYETNDKKGVTFESSDSLVATIDDAGVIKALAAGSTKITVKSKSDAKVFKDFTVKVLEPEDAENLSLAAGMETDLGYKASDGYTFTTSNAYIATVNDDGILITELSGNVTIKILKDGVIVKVFNVDVLVNVRNVTLEGPESIYYNDLVKLEVGILPNSAYKGIRFEVEDDSILEVDTEGVITPIKAGTTKISVHSLQDDVTSDEINVTVKPVVVVSKDLSDTVIGNFEFRANTTLFDNFEDAVAAATTDTKVLLNDYNYTNEINLTKGITIEGNNASIEGVLNIHTEDAVKLQNLTFKNVGQIKSASNANLTLDRVIVLDINQPNFITLSNVNNFEMINSTITNVNNATGSSILLDNIGGSANIYLSDNNFDNLGNAITIVNDKLFNDDASIKLYYNTITNTESPFEITMFDDNVGTNAELYARFNEVTDYNKAINQYGPQIFEYTFNYWGEFNIGNFDNVEEAMLLGHYENNEDILTKTIYNPEVPILVEVTNMPEQIELGMEHEFEFVTLPYTADNSRYYITLNNHQLTDLIGFKTLKPYRSGLLGVTIGSYTDLSKAVTYNIDLTTDPGMTFKMDQDTAGIVVGDVFNVSAMPFPYTLEGEEVKYSSSNPSIASVNSSNGRVEILSAGDFEVVAQLVSDTSVEQRLPLTSYNELNENNLMDFYIMSQSNYSKVHDITFHGTSIATGKLSEPVTRLLVDDVQRTEDIIPVTPGFRPGVKFSTNIPEEYRLNEQNLVWVVVHDTGNSNVGAGAAMHANYLMNQVLNSGRKASWHYTVDPKEIYQHMPLDEVAYHAGDGSALPNLENESPALGGGNRSGIGIEMSIQRDGDQFKTWQNTARLSAELLDNHNLPLSHLTYHYDFSGKECPQTLRRAGLVWLFEEYVANEYHLRKTFGPNADVQIISKSPEILSNTGQIINIPNHSTVVEYDIVVTQNGIETIQTFRTLVEGLYR